MKNLLLIVLAFMCSCVSESEVYMLENQEAASKIVWVDTFHAKGNVPEIEWITGEALNCAEGKGWVFEDGDCVFGVSWRGGPTKVAWYEGANFSTTAFAHELCHAYEDQLGIIDTNHSGPCFVAGGLVEKANAALREKGL